MTHTRSAKSRVFAGLATFATVTAVTIPLLATAASAAVSSVTATSPAASSPAGVGNTATVPVTVTRAPSTDTTAIRFVIVSGPDTGVNAANVADGTCSTNNATAVNCVVTNGGTSGSDLVRVFADSNDNSVLDAGEPTSDATVVFYGAAAVVDLSPAADTAAAGTCNAYTATVTDSGARAVPNATVLLEANLTGTTTNRVLAFCDPGTTNPTSSAAGGDDTTAGTGSPTQAQGSVTTDATGKATFGIISNQTGTASVLAYVNTNAVAGFQAGEPNDTSTKTFTAGGAAGNAAQDAVATLTVTPTSQNSVVNDNPKYTVTAKNAAGDTVPNVTVSATIAGPNAAAPITFTPAATNNSGVTVFSYTPTAPGTDTITFFVNQTAGATAGADSNEPKATATDSVAAAPTGYTIDLTCPGTVFGGTAKPAPGGETAGQKETREETCVNPTTDNDEVFTALVSKGVDAVTGAPTPAAGILVRFTTANTTAPGTPVLSAASGVSDAKGLVTVTLTDVKEVNLSQDSVTATIAGQTTPQAVPAGQNADTATKTWQTAVPTTVAVTPALNTAQTGTASTFTATITDQFGKPVAGVNTDFFIVGRNVALNGAGLIDKITNAAGQATATYTDTGATNVASNDTVGALADYVTENDAQNGAEPVGTAQNNFITEPATAASVDIDVTNNCGASADPANDAISYDPALTVRTICATAKTAGNPTPSNLAGKTITFTLTGVGSFVSADGKTVLTSPQTAVIDNTGVARLTVRSTASGSQTIVASLDGKTDTGVITYNPAKPTAARYIDLKPDTSNIVAGKDSELTALVTDLFGNPVAGITVDFTETGAGSFANGTSSQSGVTGATGTVSITLSSAAGSTGTETVTAAISAAQAGASQCGALVNTPNVGDKAGNCTDSSTYTFAVAKAATFVLGTNVIAAGQFTKVVITGAPGDTVQILVKGAASSSYTVIASRTLNSAGSSFLIVSPSTSSNYFVRNAVGSAAPKFLLVKAVQSINVAKSGTTGVFTGLVKPSLKGRTVIVYGYLTGGHVATLCTTTVKAGGKFACNAPGLLAGKTYHVFAQTGADKFNAAGRSGLKDLTI